MWIRRSWTARRWPPPASSPIRRSLVVDSPGFDRLIVNGAQIFTGTQTVQDMMLLPTPSLPESYSRTETVTIPAQTL